MKFHIHVIGKLRKGSEAEFTSDYLRRAERMGRELGLGPVSLSEYEARSGQDESELILAKIPPEAVLVALDERGSLLSSKDFARMVENERDRGTRMLAFAIGGADGHSEALRNQAQHLVSFGRMTLPHKLVRIVLAEQIYRGVTIISGHPYHREG